VKGLACGVRGSVLERSVKAARASVTWNDRRCYKVLASMTMTESGSARWLNREVILDRALPTKETGVYSFAMALLELLTR